MDAYSLANIQLIPQQEKFLLSRKRFPCFIGGVGVGKTMILLLKAVQWAQTYPKSQCYLVRKESTDLQDSTIVDFIKYFGVKPNSKFNVDFENGSQLMFRHAGEINHANLKNLTLDFVGIEQGEELENDDQFNFLRERLRGKSNPILNPNGTPRLDSTGKPDYLQQMCIIANSNGHNWIWRKWLHDVPSEEYELIKATTFDNIKNLPAGFVADMRSMEKDAPSHYKRMVMNSFDDDLSVDNVFSTRIISKSASLNLTVPCPTRFVAGLDVGRFGDDPSCLTILAQVGIMSWKQVFMEERLGWDATQVSGWVIDMHNTFPFDIIGVDSVGLGSGTSDILHYNNKFSCYDFIANAKPNGNSPYINKKVEGYFKLEKLMSQEHMQILDDIKLHEELSNIRFYYKHDFEKDIVSKNAMKSKGIKSPNKADALMIATYYAENESEMNWDDAAVPGIPGSHFQGPRDAQTYAITE